MQSAGKCTVYVLESQRNPRRHYVGVTGNLDRRLASHNAGENTSTAANRPWTVLATIQLRNEATAADFEPFLKSASGRAFAKRHFR